MPQVESRPSPEAVRIRSGPFPEGGLLPTTLAERRQNLNVQARDENAEKARRRRRAAEGGPAYSSTSCTKSITISLFFDGTNNHEPSDREAKPPNTSNIVRLFHAVFATETHGRARTTPPSRTRVFPCVSVLTRLCRPPSP
ncbi:MULTISPECIES: hypothetical protein [Chromobacterium]|uniref:hypothetical protein n=1 Tax=Chromobacterium TaxID=535 RepID=UPI0011B21579|nr:MULTISPECIES: hypothetical protein [Chromobacterium]QOD81342.1 hypothetical protein IEZ30_15580 [Chromobacterium haemolyticum]